MTTMECVSNLELRCREFPSRILPINFLTSLGKYSEPVPHLLYSYFIFIIFCTNVRQHFRSIRNHAVVLKYSKRLELQTDLTMIKVVVMPWADPSVMAERSRICRHLKPQVRLGVSLINRGLHSRGRKLVWNSKARGVDGHPQRPYPLQLNIKCDKREGKGKERQGCFVIEHKGKHRVTVGTAIATL